MMIFRGEGYQELGLTPEQIQEQMGKWFAWGDKMAKANQLAGGHALKPEIKRVSGKNRTVTDGIYGESKELVGGFYLVQANSFEEVMVIAEDYPDYQFGGTVEIREVQVFDNE